MFHHKINVTVLMWLNVKGDKEAFWIALETLKIPYYFNPIRAGAIGYTKSNRVCGNLVHVNTKREVVWMNGGMFKFGGKTLGNLSYETFTDIIWFESLSQMQDGKWGFDKSGMKSCIHFKRGDVNPLKLGSEMERLLNDQTDLQKKIVDALDIKSSSSGLTVLEKLISSYTSRR